MTRKNSLVAVAGVLALVLTACGGNKNSDTKGSSPATDQAAGSSDTGAGNKAGKPFKTVVVVKLTGVGWFDRMESGLKEIDGKDGVFVRQVGADDASPEKQVKILQDLIAEKPDVIAVVPNSPESLEGVLKQAQSAGIKVVTHEASNQQNTDVDIEAFNNKDYGAHIMDNLAKCMNNEGTYVAFVGHLTAKSHMEWVEGGLEQAAAKYPKIKRVEEPIEALEDATVSYQKTKELLAKYPDLKGFQGSASTDVPGIGRAIQEASLQDKTCVMGTSIPSVSGKFLDDGSVDKIFFWDPALAGQAQVKLGAMLVRGEEIKDGLDLGIKGYDSIHRLADTPHAFAGSAWIDVDKDNAKDYPF